MKTRKPLSGHARGRPAPAFRTSARLAAALVALLAFAGCGGLEGVYASRDGSGSLEFRRDGTVYVTVFGGTYVGEYDLDGTRVIVKGPNGTQVYTRSADRLDGDFGTVFVRQPRAARRSAGEPDARGTERGP